MTTRREVDVMTEIKHVSIPQLMVSVRHFADATKLLERDIEQVGGMCWEADESCVGHMTAASMKMTDASRELEAALQALAHYRVAHKV